MYVLIIIHLNQQQSFIISTIDVFIIITDCFLQITPLSPGFISAALF